MTTRRGFLAGLLAAAAPVSGWAAAGNPDFLACAQDADGTHAIHGLRADGSLAFRQSLPARGHAGAAHPRDAVAVVFARRPGSYALVLDCRDGQVIRSLTPPADRQFNGHGLFLDGGARLATSEQVAATSDGVIGFWDSTTGDRLGEVPSGGIGPHEIRAMPDGTICVANGGIATDPGDRTKLNIPDMRPNLSFLSADGDLLSTVTLPDALHQCSIRHLAVRADGLTGFAMQWEGDPAVTMPLLGLVRPGAAPVLAQAPAAEAALMQGYAGSVAWAGDGASIAITSPRGGRVQRFDSAGAFLDAVARPDICGAAPMGRGILTSDGGGALIALEDGQPRLLGRHPVAWDNHIVALG